MVLFPEDLGQKIAVEILPGKTDLTCGCKAEKTIIVLGKELVLVDDNRPSTRGPRVLYKYENGTTHARCGDFSGPKTPVPASEIVKIPQDFVPRKKDGPFREGYIVIDDDDVI